jgi:hypothetical protein
LSKIARRDFNLVHIFLSHSLFHFLFKIARRDFNFIEINEFSRIEETIQQEHSSSKIRYRSSSKLRTFTQRRAQQATRKINSNSQLNVCKIEVISFNRLTRKKNHDSFVLLMKEIDFFLEKFSSISKSLEMKVSSNLVLSLVKTLSFSSIYQLLLSQANLHDKKIHLALFKMNKALTLQIVVTRKKLNAYRENKNVDSTSLFFK